jgi:hypothetical protein
MEGEGVVARQGLEEAGGKTRGRRTETGYKADDRRVIWQWTEAPDSHSDATVEQGDVHRLFLSRFSHPVIEAVSRDEAAPLFCKEGPLEKPTVDGWLRSRTCQFQTEPLASAKTA